VTRTSRTRRLLALFLTAVGLGAGCTTTSTGDPTAENTSATTSKEPSERPRDIRLDGLDPCALIPEADQPEFYIDKPGTPQENKTLKSPQCIWTGTEVGAFDLTLVTTGSLEKWLGSNDAVESKDVEPIEDFPATEIHLKGQRNNNPCDVAVDVADDQFLVVTALIDELDLSKVPGPCEYAHDFAESAMSTLVN